MDLSQIRLMLLNNHYMRVLKKLFAIFSICLLNSCSNNYKTIFYIPNNYTGWVNIRFEDTLSTNIIEKKSNEFTFFIDKHPENFSVKSKLIPEGFYEHTFYYYNKNTFIKLKSIGYPLNNIFFNNFITLHEYDDQNQLRNVTFYSFYVSKNLLNSDSVSIEKLPKNPILK